MVPVFWKFFLPVLKSLDDNKIHTIKSTMGKMATHFQLSDSDCEVKVKSGKTTQLYDRVQWAMTYLKRAGLISSPSRGNYEITPKGKDVLSSGITEMNQKYLSEISPEFADFIKIKKKGNEDSLPSNECPTAEHAETSPEEVMEQTYARINSSLAYDLLERVMQNSPAFFERLVIDLLVKMGYGGNREDAAMVTQLSHDGGIDGIIKEDRLGLEKIYIQAKRWEATVQKPEIQKFVGALSEKHAHKGIFITTSNFSNGAKESARSAKIVLIDGPQLCNLMIEFGVGVSIKTVYEIKRVDSDYFDPNIN